MHKNILTIGTLFCRTGEGISRDVRTVGEFGHRARPVITNIDASGDKAHNPDQGHDIPQQVITDQINQSFKSFDIDAVKLGFLGSATQVKTVADALLQERKNKSFPLVIDPGILNSDESRNYDKNGLDAVKREFLIYTDIMTPSVKETEILTGMTIRDPDQMREAGEILLTYGCKAVLVRGGMFGEDETLDVLFTEQSEMQFRQPKLLRDNISGAGGYGGLITCIIAICLSQGLPYKQTIEKALSHVKTVFLSDM